VRPEEALDVARERAEAARARGAYGDDLQGFRVAPTDQVTVHQLFEWAVLEPDVELVRSTRRYGAPITWAKRGLVHVLRQYLGQIVAEQTRFNLWVATHLQQLDDRVQRLEQEAERRRSESTRS
jgi:hypothetical protein